jgi:hypothetical protein
MKILTTLAATGLLMCVPMWAQDKFAITGTPIPLQLLKLNYGPLPKGIQAYDLNICNLTDARHPITSSEIFQALTESQGTLRPIGRQIMLAVILHNQNHNVKTWVSLGLTSVINVVSILGPTHSRVPALSALIGQQLLATWNPVLTADQVEKFESQVLESALLMDGGSCLERTVFTLGPAEQKPSQRPQSNFKFHVR